MGSTTLVTFLFDYPAAARTVELLGSWDNFSKPYPLKQDKRRGHGIWSGCYTFDDIICDGDLDNLGAKRNGALKMGGTYWYYYKVDDEEHHNPSEPSTTVCPLLPGQHLNVLEVPRESRSRSNSECSGIFTRNPRDKFLTPVPPTPLPSPRLGDSCKEAYAVQAYSARGPRSATYPPARQLLSPGYERHTRSASTTPLMPSAATFGEFKLIKEKLSSKRLVSHTRDRSRDALKMQIGAPTLVSTTTEQINLVPLSSLPPPPPPPVRTPQTSSIPPPITAKLREFSPLGSHPVDPAKDLDFGSGENVSDEEEVLQRPKSHTPEGTSPELPGSPSRFRSNSAGTRRTKLFCNEPWLSSPRFPYYPGLSSTDLMESSRPAPVLERPSASLEPPTFDARPSSSYGGNPTPSLRKSPLLTDKELPALPRYIVAAPLFACNSDSICEREEDPEKHDDNERSDSIHLIRERSSHFSTWSSESAVFSSPASDEGAVYSPTFSSLTSNCSDMGSLKHDSARFSISDYMHSPDRMSVVIDEDEGQDEGFNEDGEVVTQSSLMDSAPQTGSAPQLNLRLPSFGPSLFNLDIHHADAAPRRHAACFGLGFQGYTLPEDDSTSQATLTKEPLEYEPAIKHNRDSSVSSVSHMTKLMNDFGYLGDAVL